jgi:hypothetical protein
MKPGGVSKRGPPRWLDKVGYDVASGGYGGGVIEPGAAKQARRDSAGLGLFWHRCTKKPASHVSKDLDPESSRSDRSNATDPGVAGSAAVGHRR